MSTPETPGTPVEEELYEEVSAFEQAMVSEERQEEGSVLTGGNTRDPYVGSLHEEVPLDEELMLNPPAVKDGQALLDYLRVNLYKFSAPYSVIGGEANTPSIDNFKTAELKILIARLSSYDAVSLSMTHSMMSQIYQELESVAVDFAFLPKWVEWNMLRRAGFPQWFGVNTKLGPDKFDILSISHAVGMEQLNFIPLLWTSGIPIFKTQRMDRPDIPIVVVGGANSGTVAPLSGSYTTKAGVTHHTIIDAAIYGDGEQAAKVFAEIVREGKKKGWSKREILKYCHGRVEGFYEPDCYEHKYDGSGRLISITPKVEHAAFPVHRATVPNLDEVRTLETKILPYTGEGASVDVSIAGSVGCIGSAGWGACSFCREGSEGPYRERSLEKVMDALEQATVNQGTKEVSFFSLNFNQYSQFFPLVKRSVERRYKVGLISQRVDMLAETPEQIRVQRWLKKSNYTLGVEGASSRMRAYLNKNLQEWEILKCAATMMQEGARELKFFFISTGLETDFDTQEMCAMMERVNAIRQQMRALTRFRVSFTPLFPSAYTALQFAPAMAALAHGTRNLDSVFRKAKELGWGRRMSVSGEEPLISNTINQGGRNITPLLLRSWFSDGYKFYGMVPKGTWVRWKARIDQDPNIDVRMMWGEKDYHYIFPWEDLAYSTSKEVLWRGYLKAVAFQGSAYCLTTRSVKGVCHVNECGACDPQKTGKPNRDLIASIVGRKVAPTIPVEEIKAAAMSREKAYHLRILFETTDPLFRFVMKGYHLHTIPRAMMKVSKKFNEAYIGPIGHIRYRAGANNMQDWTFGQNILDFKLGELISESELKEIAEKANAVLEEGKILDLRMDATMSNLYGERDYALYSVFIPNEEIHFKRIRGDIERWAERQGLGKVMEMKKKITAGKGIFKVVKVMLEEEDVRQVSYQFEPEKRGTLIRFMARTSHNALSILESVTKRRAAYFRRHPIHVDGYVQLKESTGDIDVFAALAGEKLNCDECGGQLEMDVFRAKSLETGVCLACDLEQYPVDLEGFFREDLKAVTGMEPVKFASGEVVAAG